jgi:hypothetical protein
MVSAEAVSGSLCVGVTLARACLDVAVLAAAGCEFCCTTSARSQHRDHSGCCYCYWLLTAAHLHATAAVALTTSVPAEDCWACACVRMAAET